MRVVLSSDRLLLDSNLPGEPEEFMLSEIHGVRETGGGIFGAGVLQSFYIELDAGVPCDGGPGVKHITLNFGSRKADCRSFYGRFYKFHASTDRTGERIRKG